MENINYQAKVIELTTQLSKIKKERSDKGKKRNSYDSSLPKHYVSYQKRSNRKGIAFDLSVEQFERIKSLPCTYCNGQSTGIDRVDSSDGYVEGNIVPCCSLCNTMKLNHSVDKFLNHINKIAKYQTQRLQEGFFRYPV